MDDHLKSAKILLSEKMYSLDDDDRQTEAENPNFRGFMGINGFASVKVILESPQHISNILDNFEACLGGVCEIEFETLNAPIEQYTDFSS